MRNMKEITRLTVDQYNAIVTYRVMGTPIGTSKYDGAPYYIETSRNGKPFIRGFRYNYKSSAMRALKREVAR
jgi:hypothetical protein